MPVPAKLYVDKQRHQDLKPLLRQGKKRCRKSYRSGARVSKIPNRVSITEQQKIVDKKTRIGDWECDSVIGLDRKSGLITVVVDRVTITFENGSELVQHEKIAKALNAKIYFAHPYSSWERGVHEYTIGPVSYTHLTLPTTPYV